MERLQKVIAKSGYCSRRKAEELIKQGLVFVNDEKVLELGVKVSSKDSIRIKNDYLNIEEKVYYLFYKPRYVVCTTQDEFKRKTVIDYINTDKRIFPVGRLDYDTSGILLLTNDGEFSNIITHPKNEIEKEYIVKINGILFKKNIEILRRGIIIDGVRCSGAKVRVLSYDSKKDVSIVSIIIHEGKYHQVKKMFEELSYEVLKLKRERISFLTLNKLHPGEYRDLSIKEVKKLFSLKKE